MVSAFACQAKYGGSIPLTRFGFTKSRTAQGQIHIRLSKGLMGVSPVALYIPLTTFGEAW